MGSKTTDADVWKENQDGDGNKEGEIFRKNRTGLTEFLQQGSEEGSTTTIILFSAFGHLCHCHYNLQVSSIRLEHGRWISTCLLSASPCFFRSLYCTFRVSVFGRYSCNTSQYIEVNGGKLPTCGCGIILDLVCM